ncbi:hypothetical protein Y032_0385g430 [Ancylostoma ceylanicum]|uniref:Peptidase M13 C-terminal domain-containing protein n=2 Tax=Ancylostoma ceylanicum TaxID=53326 RepID=A0A016RST2_9BILA|nr:hypothetical protein Y032_0385g430 [Ancylostoma ceylanicum]
MYNDSKISRTNLKVDGIKTLPENIADNEGVKLAFKAYRKLEKKYGAEGRFVKMQDFTNEQMFFLAYSMVFCNKLVYIPLYLELILKEDDHAPAMLRCETNTNNDDITAEKLQLSSQTLLAVVRVFTGSMRQLKP